ncbi:class I SAM-dependent methyltransferase [Trichormus sp. NMC-1]|uniref:class I SAM-dependent methyltransferase n=1 Tax=Trichormus sp. NMC-1 TaxID=1853259 RepID=UPI0008DC1023|nr:class I SAM-dependent methyltransferase [Trichormus sp. NMC-1]
MEISKILDDTAFELIQLMESSRWGYKHYWHLQGFRIHETFRILLDKISNLSDPCILDVGCNPPFLTATLTKLKIDCLGVDLCPESFVDVTDKYNLSVIQADIEQERIPLEDESYDVVILTEVFEHLRINPIHTCSEMYRLVKPGGFLLLSTPNLHSVNGIYNFLFKGQAYTCTTNSIYDEFDLLNKFGFFGHMREYTWQEVESFLIRIGFKTVHTQFLGGASLRPYLKPLYSMFPKLKPIVHFVAYK